MSKTTEDLYKKYQDALQYVGKIGKTEPHFRDARSVGKISAIKLKTEICHQSSPGAQNYWEDADFDEALSAVVRSKFHDLAKDALCLMKQKAEMSLINEEEDLKKRLDEIQKLKQSVPEKF